MHVSPVLIATLSSLCLLGNAAADRTLRGDGDHFRSLEPGATSAEISIPNPYCGRFKPNCGKPQGSYENCDVTSSNINEMYGTISGKCVYKTRSEAGWTTLIPGVKFPTGWHEVGVSYKNSPFCYCMCVDRRVLVDSDGHFQCEATLPLPPA